MQGGYWISQDVLSRGKPNHLKSIQCQNKKGRRRFGNLCNAAHSNRGVDTIPTRKHDEYALALKVYSNRQGTPTRQQASSSSATESATANSGFGKTIALKEEQERPEWTDRNWWSVNADQLADNLELDSQSAVA